MEETENLEGKVDFGIITTREDEFASVLKHFPKTRYAKGRHRSYVISDLSINDTETYVIACVRCVEQGISAAQDVARDLIEDLKPQWILLVGIAGGVPEYEFTLGDVVIATRLNDFSVEAAIEGEPTKLDGKGGYMHKSIQDLLAILPAMTTELKGWNNKKKIGQDQPPVEISNERLYGDDSWKSKVKKTLLTHFNSSKKRRPICTTAPIASSNKLVKDADLLEQWQESAKQIKAVEMELSGVYTAARRMDREYPILAIRGISDIVGFERDSGWTSYACNTAAAFAYALIMTRPLEPLSSRDTTKTKTEKLKAETKSQFFSNPFKGIDNEKLFNLGTILIKQARERIVLVAKTPIIICGTRPYGERENIYPYEIDQLNVLEEIMKNVASKKDQLKFHCVASKMSLSEDLREVNSREFSSLVKRNLELIYKLANQKGAEISIKWCHDLAPMTYLVADNHILIWLKDYEGDKFCFISEDFRVANALWYQSMKETRDIPLNALLQELKILEV